MSVDAHVLHRLPGRIRLRLPLMRGDPGYFEQLQKNLQIALPDVQVRINPVAASVLVTGPEDSVSRIPDLGHERDWFIVTSDADRPGKPGDRASAGHQLHRPALIAVLLSLAVVQILRGSILVPATTLLWYAYVVDAGFLSPDTD